MVKYIRRCACSILSQFDHIITLSRISQDWCESWCWCCCICYRRFEVLWWHTGCFLQSHHVTSDNSLVTCDSTLSSISTQCVTEHFLSDMSNSWGIYRFIYSLSTGGTWSLDLRHEVSSDFWGTSEQHHWQTTLHTKSCSRKLHTSHVIMKFIRIL